VGKTWNQKLNHPRPAKVEVTTKAFAGIGVGAKMLIPTPILVRDYVAAIPPGKASTIPQMKKDLAARFGAEVTCPLTSGIFIRIVAEAALEDLAHGKPLDEITPFWRLIAPTDKIVLKLSGGREFIEERRAAEGIP